MHALGKGSWNTRHVDDDKNASNGIAAKKDTKANAAAYT